VTIPEPLTGLPSRQPRRYTVRHGEACQLSSCASPDIFIPSRKLTSMVIVTTVLALSRSLWL